MNKNKKKNSKAEEKPTKYYRVFFFTPEGNKVELSGNWTEDNINYIKENIGRDSTYNGNNGSINLRFFYGVTFNEEKEERKE